VFKPQELVAVVNIILAVFLIKCTHEVTANHGYETYCEFCTYFAFRFCVVKAFSLNCCAVEVPINFLCFTDLECVQLFSYMKNAAMKTSKRVRHL